MICEASVCGTRPCVAALGGLAVQHPHHLAGACGRVPVARGCEAARAGAALPGCGEGVYK